MRIRKQNFLVGVYHFLDQWGGPDNTFRPKDAASGSDLYNVSKSCFFLFVFVIRYIFYGTHQISATFFCRGRLNKKEHFYFFPKLHCVLMRSCCSGSSWMICTSQSGVNRWFPSAPGHVFFFFYLSLSSGATLSMPGFFYVPTSSFFVGR